MKGYNSPSILCAVLLFGAVIVSPAFAEMKKVDEAELARTNASVTGTSVKGRINCVEKDGICAENKQDSVTVNKVVDNNGAAVSSQGVSTTNNFASFSLNINGQETFQFGMSGISSNTTGGVITSAKMR